MFKYIVIYKGNILKSRNLYTIHDLIISNYTITAIGNGKFKHSFTPKTTNTVYEFEGNNSPIVEEGERYNIGYNVVNGKNIIEQSALSKTTEVNPIFSFMYAQQLANENKILEKDKNETRVSYNTNNGYYWGKKYAWRMFGSVISKAAFYKYMDESNHPSIPCIINNPDLPYKNEESIAYKEEGLEEKIRNLISTAVLSGQVYYKSPLYSKRFSIRGIKAITDKK